MREEIRLGNEALANHDLEAAKQHFEHLLATGGTALQERIATNRLREIQEQQDALKQPTSTKSRTRRKTAERTKHDVSAKHTFIRPPDKPIVVIKRH